jgi:hypothetical protein
MKLKLAAILVLLAGTAFLCTSCAEPKKAIRGIYSSLDEGWLISDDIFFTNKSGEDLHEVKINVTVIGHKGDKASVRRYWASWKQGELKTISIPVGQSVTNIQKIEMDGKCDEGYFSLYWTPKK